MNIFGLNISKRNRIKNQDLNPETYTRTEFWEEISNATSTNREMKIAAVFRCIDVLSDNISMLPWISVDSKTHEKPDDEYTRQVWYLLNIRPNRNMTPAVFFKTLEQHRLNGNAYSEIITAGNGFPIELKILNPNNVQPKELDNGDVVYDTTDKKKNTRRLLSDEVLHFKNISYDGLMGKGVLSYASSCVSSMEYQEQFNKNFYRKGGRPSGVLQVASDISNIETKRKKDGIALPGENYRDLLRKDFEKHTAGAENAGRVAVLDNGFTYSPIQPISQKDMAFVESKEVSIADIARFYGVPLYKLFTGKESYQSNSSNNIAFVTDKLNPIVTGYENELSYKLIMPERLRAGVQIKANLNVLLRGDIDARAKYYATMRSIGAMSVNQIRDKEDMSSVEGGDELYASLNYVPLGDFKRLSLERNSKQNTGGGNKNN